MLKTRSQKYAADVYARIEEIKNNNDSKTRDEFLSLARSFPVLVKAVGLAQALAFLAAKERKQREQEGQPANAHGLLLKHLSESVTGGDQLLKKCRDDSLHEYMRLTRASLEALLWYKRFAESLLNA